MHTTNLYLLSHCSMCKTMFVDLNKFFFNGFFFSCSVRLFVLYSIQFSMQHRLHLICVFEYAYHLFNILHNTFETFDTHCFNRRCRWRYRNRQTNDILTLSHSHAHTHAHIRILVTCWHRMNRLIVAWNKLNICLDFPNIVLSTYSLIGQCAL